MRLLGFVIVVVLAAMVAAYAAPAFAQEVNPDAIAGFISRLVGDGGGQTWVVAVAVLLAVVRAVAATLSKHVTDERLGELSGVVNWLGGNTKKATNKP